MPHAVASREARPLDDAGSPDAAAVLMNRNSLDVGLSNLDVRVLPDNGRVVVGVDRAHPGSSSGTGRDGDPVDEADDLLHLLEALDLQDIVIVGLARGSGELVGYRSRPGDGILSRIPIAGRSRNTAKAGLADALAPIVEYVQQHLRDPDLCAESIARAHHMSVRLLYKVWAANSDRTLAEYIICSRLAAIRGDLTNPALNHVSISTIASGWGFINAAHFSRRFRAAHGMTAKQCRRDAMTHGIR